MQIPLFILLYIIYSVLFLFSVFLFLSMYIKLKSIGISSNSVSSLSILLSFTNLIQFTPIGQQLSTKHLLSPDLEYVSPISCIFCFNICVYICSLDIKDVSTVCISCSKSTSCLNITECNNKTLLILVNMLLY